MVNDRFDDSCCILTNKGLFHVEQIGRGQPNNHNLFKNTKELSSCKNIIHGNKFDRWCLKKFSFTHKARISESLLRSQSSVDSGQIERRASNTLSMLSFLGLLKTCLINYLHIQELRESILFCWVVHQGTFSSLVSLRGGVSSHFPIFLLSWMVVNVVYKVRC